MNSQKLDDCIRGSFALFIIACLLFSTLLVPGCSQTPAQPETSPESPEADESPVPTPPKEAPQVAPPPAPAPSSGITSSLQIGRAPKAGESVEVTYVYSVGKNAVADPSEITKIWIEFERYDSTLYYPSKNGVPRVHSSINQPESSVDLGDILEKGKLTWEGEPLQRGETLQLQGTVNFIEPGEWQVTVFTETTDGEIRKSSKKLTVNEDSGMFGWPEDYSVTYNDWQPPGGIEPVGVVIIPQRAPLLDEPFELTLVISSIRDVDYAEAGLDLRCEGETVLWERVPVEDILIKGEPVWRGSLKEGVPVEVPLTVAFPKEGDWRMHAWGRTSSDEHTRPFRHNIYLHIGKEESRFSWTRPHENRANDPPSLPAIDIETGELIPVE